MRKRDLLHTGHRAGGFTLVELMVTLAIVAILMMIAAPQLRSFLQKQQVAADIETLITSLRVARSEALKRSGRVSVCALTADEFTDPTKAKCKAITATDWSNGWMVYIDYSNGAGFNSATDTVLKIERTVKAGSLVSTSPPGGIVSFQSNGIAVGDQGHFDIQPASDGAAQCRRLILSPQGRIRTENACGA
jgi:type IV fimbrial biogenesis protein FimT